MSDEHEGHQHDHSNEEVTLSIEGMTCNNCVATVARTIQSVSNVVDPHIDLDRKEAHLHGVLESGVDPQEFVDAINAVGYKTKIKSAGQTSSLWSRWSTMVFVGATLTAIMMVGDWVFGWQSSPSGRITLLILSSIIQLYCGNAFLKGAIHQLKKGRSDMDTLVALGSWTAYLYSTWSFFSQNGHHLYFAEAGSIISLVSLGHFLESKISERAQSSLKKLIGLQNDRVAKINVDGSITIVSASKLQIGDRISLKSGDRIPVDAKTLDGGASLDESAISGESHPIEKSPGDKLISGTLLLDGQITAQVTAVGRETALAQIIETVRKAQNSRASIQKVADRISSIFVPVVVLLSLCAFSLWYWLPSQMISLSNLLSPHLWPAHLDPSRMSQAIMCAVGVLIIACPCAMGLATPAALMAGANRAARNGVLIRDASAIEKSATITHIFFDKTGTLTQGKLSVTEQFKNAPDSDIAPWALALASKSNHPISIAIKNYYTSTNSTLSPGEFSKFKEERGKGLIGNASNGDVYRLGSLTWHTNTLQLKSPLLDKANNLTSSVNVLSRNHDILAVFLLKDTPKLEAKMVIEQLRSSKIEVGIISGDRKAVVFELANELGLNLKNVHSEIAPENKAAVIEALQKSGSAVAFVGDGINDAPALKMATLGIAVSSATDIAKDSADLILIKNDIQQIPWALDISARTLSTIKQNLFWAFCYNTLAIPVAFLGLVSPIICAAAMGLSDIFVILNSLRLAMYRSKFASQETNR